MSKKYAKLDHSCLGVASKSKNITMHIDQLSRITGVSIQSIRHYEQAGLLPSVAKFGDTESYTESHVHAIKLIKMAQDVGLSLREIINILSAKDSDQSSLRLNRALMLLNKKRGVISQDTCQHDKIRTIDNLERELEALFLP